MTVIYTHMNVDLDAVVGSCVELYRLSLEPTSDTIKFVSADTTMEEIPDGGLPVDIRARKHGNADSFVGAYCTDLLPPNIVDEVNEQDSKGYSRNRVPLALLIASLATYGMTDLEIVQQCYPMVVGWIKLQGEWKETEKYFHTLERVQLGKYTYIISKSVEHRSLSSIAVRNGVNGTIFWSKTGCGISRYPGQDKPDLSTLGLVGWFHHPIGFLACWGSRKAPKSTLPPQFKTVEEFILWLDTRPEFVV